ncbi:MAG: restriction endonuclease subunit S [Burkholderiales bacterium]|nr:restriction endonuclease subunit S [Burkholderiales bacterium]
MPQDMQDGRIVTNQIARVDSKHVERLKKHKMRVGDVVYSRRGDVGRFAIVSEAEAGWLCGTGCIRIRLNCPDIDIAYVRRYLQQEAVAKWLDHHAKGVTMPNLNTTVIRALPFVYPPLPEQRRIAEILDKADALRTKRRTALAQLDTLTQSIFLDMFGDPATNPKGWPVKRIEDITECLDRLRRPVTESDRKQGNVPYYGANGQQGWIDTALFDEPLVLVAEDGGYFDEPARGVAYRIDGPAWVNNHAHILRAMPTHVDTEFLHRALRHFNFLPFISGTTRAKLTQGQLNTVKLFVPPLELQRELGERVAGVQRIAQVTASSSDQLHELFAALQYRAFRGAL